MNVVVPTFSSEVSNAELRGRLFGLIFLAVSSFSQYCEGIGY